MKNGQASYIVGARLRVASVAEAAGGQYAAVAHGRGTILVVEDGEAVRQVIATMLRESGYTVMQCANAREAIPLGEHFDGEISLLVTDVVLPDTYGPDLARRLQAVRPHMAVLFITGYGETVLTCHGIDPRITPVLVKPFSRDELIKTVGTILAPGRDGRQVEAPSEMGPA